MDLLIDACAALACDAGKGWWRRVKLHCAVAVQARFPGSSDRQGRDE
jgi:hypothetical protein